MCGTFRIFTLLQYVSVNTTNVLVALTETYCNKVNIQITQRDDFIQKGSFRIHFITDRTQAEKFVILDEFSALNYSVYLLVTVILFC